MREGRTLRVAIETGWRAGPAHHPGGRLVSFLAAVVLYVLSIGSVRGFAFTLGLTTLIDLVVVFLFTKPMMTLLARTTVLRRRPPLSGLDPDRIGGKARTASGPASTIVARRSAAAAGGAERRSPDGPRAERLGARLYRGEVSYDFVGRRRLWYAISGGVILISLVALVVRGLNLGIEFRAAPSSPSRCPPPRSTQAQSAVAAAGVDRYADRHQSSVAPTMQVQTEQLTSAESTKVQDALAKSFGLSPTEVEPAVHRPVLGLARSPTRRSPAWSSSWCWS